MTLLVLMFAMKSARNAVPPKKGNIISANNTAYQSPPHTNSHNKIKPTQLTNFRADGRDWRKRGGGRREVLLAGRGKAVDGGEQVLGHDGRVLHAVERQHRPVPGKQDSTIRQHRVNHSVLPSGRGVADSEDVIAANNVEGVRNLQSRNNEENIRTTIATHLDSS